jgi:hypothetical protein
VLAKGVAFVGEHGSPGTPRSRRARIAASESDWGTIPVVLACLDEERRPNLADVAYRPS